MKLTKSQLRQIVKEEVKKLIELDSILSEQVPGEDMLQAVPTGGDYPAAEKLEKLAYHILKFLGLDKSAEENAEEEQRRGEGDFQRVIKTHPHFNFPSDESIIPWKK